MWRERRWFFATDYAHDLSIHIPEKSGAETILPVTADPKMGGFVVDAKALSENKLDQEATGYLRGMWGFQPFNGPSFHLASAKPEQWRVGPGGRKRAHHGDAQTRCIFNADSSACVKNVTCDQ